MIKKVTDINSLSGVLSPLLPLICGDFVYPYNDTDGAYIQLDENEDITAVLSLKNGSATVVKMSSSVDINEIKIFLSFSCVTSFISDFPLKFSNEKTYNLLTCVPDKKKKTVHIIFLLSRVFPIINLFTVYFLSVVKISPIGILYFQRKSITVLLKRCIKM